MSEPTDDEDALRLQRVVDETDAEMRRERLMDDLVTGGGILLLTGVLVFGVLAGIPILTWTGAIGVVVIIAQRLYYARKNRKRWARLGQRP